VEEGGRYVSWSRKETVSFERGKGETERENSQSDTNSERRLQELPNSNQSSLPLLLLGQNIHDVLVERIRVLFESDVRFSSGSTERRSTRKGSSTVTVTTVTVS